MDITYTFCPICGALADDICQAHPDCAGVTEAHHPDDYATAKQARAYARAQAKTIQDFHVLLNALTRLRKEQGLSLNTLFGSMPRKRAWEGILYGLSRSIRSQVVFDSQRCIMPSESVLPLLYSGILRHAP